MFYVRTEQRPGADAPEHLFAKAYRRTVFQLWTGEIPEDAELVIDAEGREQATESQSLLQFAEHDI